MAPRPFILIVDDEPEILEMYRDVLAQLPSHPEIHTATSGARAIAMLESVAYAVFLCDLRMPAMDGLQVLAIVRRKFPHLRTVILTGMTGLADEHYRARAYAMGVDLFIEKPHREEEIRQLKDCVESLLDSELQHPGGFRGVQEKSLVDIIQLECLCRNSAVLRIRSENGEGRIWFQDGEIIDAQATNLSGAEAFRRILSWKTGNFEMAPAEPDRPRTILESYQGLLLESAQANDEAQGRTPEAAAAGDAAAQAAQARQLCRFPGVEFGLVVARGSTQPADLWALESAQPAVQWLTQTLSLFQALGEELRVGELRRIEGLTMQHRILMAQGGRHEFAAAFDRRMPVDQQREILKRIMNQWDS